MCSGQRELEELNVDCHQPMVEGCSRDIIPGTSRLPLAGVNQASGDRGSPPAEVHVLADGIQAKVC